MFPARAGMSRDVKVLKFMSGCVPRASGDEPTKIEAASGLSVCSPRERG